MPPNCPHTLPQTHFLGMSEVYKASPDPVPLTLTLILTLILTLNLRGTINPGLTELTLSLV